MDRYQCKSTKSFMIRKQTCRLYCQIISINHIALVQIKIHKRRI